jgi:hypothetical protein
MAKLLHEVTAIAGVPLAQAARAVEAVLPAPGPSLTVEKDRVNGFYSVQGGWWYRGEYQLEQVAGGTRITHRVLNVAKTGRWAVPLANKLFVGFRARTDANFAKFIQGLKV